MFLWPEIWLDFRPQCSGYDAFGTCWGRRRERRKEEEEDEDEGEGGGGMVEWIKEKA